MQWLSRSGEEFAATVAKHGEHDGIDVLVVGSGYGGAVAALRFAQAGRTVTVLERGAEYVAGEFPADISQAGGHLRAEMASTSGVAAMGNEDALFDLRLGLRAGALVGNGLGGTSLINAGVGLKPDERVFQQQGWPAAIRQDAHLDRWFRIARDELELQKADDADAGATGRSIQASPKYQRLKDFAGAADARLRPLRAGFEAVPIAVEMRDQPPTELGHRQPCIGCGDCVTGCNHHAKLSLTATYLPRAYRAGATFFTGLTVLAIRYDPRPQKEPGADDPHPWVVTWVRTAERKLGSDIAGGPTDGAPFESTVRAAAVVLSAGTFGSTEILLRSRARGLAVSTTALGMQVSGNGDDVSFAYDLAEKAHAVGAGSGPRTGFVGPTITAAVRIDDDQDVRRSTLVEDGAVPGLIGGLFHELTTTLATAAQLDRPALRRGGDDDPLALSPEILARSMALLGMGHDSGNGVIAYDKASDRISWGWPDAGREAVAQRHLQRQSAVEDLGAVFLQNPATNVLPRALSAVLSGPAPGGAVFTVHPLGGCRMSDDPYTGVVTDWGGVWRADREGVFPGLYVLDGSIVPTSLGVNPLLTITALAERACDMILRGSPRADRCRPLPAAPERPVPPKAPVAPLETVLTEVLRDRRVHLEGAWAARAGLEAAGPAPATPAVHAALFAAMHVPDWQAVLRDPAHRVELVTDAPAGSYRASRLEVQVGEHKEVLLATAPSVVHLFRDVTPGGWERRWRRLRLAATYLINRWLPDQFKPKKPGEPSPARRRIWPRVVALIASRLVRVWLPGPPGEPDFDVVGAWRLLGHANEVREFRYEVKLRSERDGAVYTLHARKVVDPAATSGDLRLWWDRRRALRRDGWWAPVARRSAWQQFSEADYEVLDESGARVAHGRLVLDLPDVLRHLPSQLRPGGDTLNALLAMAGYPLFLLRLLLKTRTLDFRAPDYDPDLVATVDPATLAKPENHFELDDVELPWLQLKDRAIEPEPPIPLDVRLSSRSEERIKIGLVRYKPASGVPATEWDARWKRTRVKSIVLVNGFAQNTRTFVAPELGDQALASRLWADGWDVWMLEYRVSPFLRASSRFCSMDDIAAYDIPAAVEKVRETVEKECGLASDSSQVFAFSHCVGSASLAMSLLGGHLARWDNDVPVPHLAGVLFSQFLPFVIGSETAQQRLQFGSLLHNVLRQDMLNFTAGTVKPDLLHAMLDRAFASAAYDKEPESHSHERCPSESDLFQLQPDSTTCKRMTGILSRLFNHDQLHPETHPRLDWYFGRTNLGVFLHGARCVEHERLVNADGQNVYVTDKKIGRYLTMPVMLLHGQDNVLFDKESLLRTGSQLERAMGGKASRPGPAALYSLGVPGYAHFDCTIGRNAPRDVFGPVVAFFAESFRPGSATADLEPFRAHASTLHRRRCMARVPATGPLIGWTRRKAGAGSPHLLRVWFEVPTDGTDYAADGVTRLRYATAQGEQVVVQRWRLEFSEGLSQPGRRPDRNKRYLRESRIGYCVADIEVPADATGQVSIEALSVHTFAGSRPSPGHEADMAQLGLPQGWGVPLAPDEIRSDVLDAAWPGGERLELLVQPPSEPLLASRPATTGAARRLTGAHVPYFHSLDNLFAGDAEAAARPPAEERGESQDPIPPAASLDAAAFDALYASARAYEEATDTVARRPDPGTLSRKRRELSGLAHACIRWTPPAPSQPFGFLAAACRHPGIMAMEQDRADLSLVRAAAAAGNARFMALLGDQIYADARAGLFDAASEIERILPRYRQAFGSPGFRALASRVPLRMILDDHEINDNWSMEELGRAAGRVRLRNALRAYEVFQRSHGPVRPGNGSGDAYFDCEGFPFFMLDTRTARWRSGERQRMMRPRQWFDLAAALLAAQQEDPHRPKFILSGSVLAPGLQQGQGAHPSRSGDTWQHSPGERRRLLEFLSQQRIEHVVLLSSDYHCSATATLELPGGLLVRAICAPPLHAPLVFANAQPHEVLAFEEVELPSGLATIRRDFVCPGEGWLDCRIEGDPGGGWRLDLDFHLRDMQSALPDFYRRHSRSYELHARVPETA